ncbi:MAG TPA: cardiolipin synthase ClsB [Casimicrobiaceae bacterium]|nr:cardiolipin synthase ClsB [Casimicrobiaceae bacterium]
MERFATGNSIRLLRNGAEYFPALCAAIDAARQEVWIETYIFADDPAGRMIAATLVRAAQRGVAVRVLVDGWGAKLYLTPPLASVLAKGGVRLMKYRPEVAPWQFRSHRLRRLHRKLCHVDGRVAFVGGINLIDDMNTPRHKPPRVDFAVRVEGSMLAPIVMTMQRLWALVELTQFDWSDVPLFPAPIATHRAGVQTAKFAIRDNLGHRRDIEHAYMAALRTAKQEIVIATAYFFPGVKFRRALAAAAQRGVDVTLLLQARVEYRLLHYASRALYGQLLAAGVTIQLYHRSFLHAKVAVVDGHWATVGSSNIDPYSLLMAREANVFVRDAQFAEQLRRELMIMIADGARRMAPERWAGRSTFEKAMTWIAYGVVRVGMGLMGYGGNEWFPRRKHRTGGQKASR